MFYVTILQKRIHTNVVPQKFSSNSKSNAAILTFFKLIVNLWVGRTKNRNRKA